MRIHFMVAAAIGLATLSALAQSAAPAAVALPAGVKINAELRTRLDSAHARVGEAVQAVTTADVKENKIKLLPKGSKLEGQVIAVTPAESPKSPAHLTIRFTRAATRHSVVIPLHVVLMDVRLIPPPLPPVFAPPPVQNPDRQDQGSGMETKTLGSMPVPAQVTGTNGNMDQMEQLTAQHPIALRALPGGGSVLISVGNFNLPKGTQLVLRTLGPSHP